MTRIAVVGHIEWVDFVPVDRLPARGEIVHSPGAFARAAGGGGVVAGVLAELGAEVEFFTALGDDAEGHAAAEQLERRGVNVHTVWRENRPTRRAITLLESAAERSIVTIGERLEPRGADPLPWPEIAHTQAVYFTAGDAEAFARARQAGVVVASPRGRAAIENVTGHPVDALIYSGRDPDESEWARRLVAHCRLLVETRGAEGGVWRGESEGRWTPAPVPGPPRDSYGCGDAFAAGFTLGLARGEGVRGAAAAGAECGARWLTRAGAP